MSAQNTRNIVRVVALYMHIFTVPAGAVTWEIYSNANGVYDAARFGDTLFLATTGGVVGFDIAAKSVAARYSILDGLPGTLVTAVAREGERLWCVARGAGVAYRNPNTGAFVEYPVIRLITPEVTQPFSVSAYGNWVFFCTSAGLVLLDTRGTTDIADDGVRLFRNELLSDTAFTARVMGDTLFVGTGRGLRQVATSDWLDPAKWTTRYSASGVRDTDTLGGSLLLATESGLFLEGTGTVALAGTRCLRVARLADSAFVATDTSGVWRVFYAVGDDPYAPGWRSQRRTVAWRKYESPRSISVTERGVFYGFIWPVGPEGHLGGTFAKRNYPGWYSYELGGTPLNYIGSLAVRKDQWVLGGGAVSAEYGRSIFRYRAGTVVDVGRATVTGIVVLGDGRYFVSQWLSGLLLFDKHDSLIAYIGPAEGLEGNLVPNISAGLNGELLVANTYTISEGFVSIVEPDLTVRRAEGIAAAGMITQVEMANDGAVWCAWSGGLERYVRSGDAWRLERTLDATNGLPSTTVRFLARSPRGLWVGTEAGAVLIENDLDVVPVPPLAGRPVTDVAEDASGNVWATDTSTLSKLSPSFELLARYSSANSPLPHIASRDPRFGNPEPLDLLSEFNEVYVGTTEGLVVLHDSSTSADWWRTAHVYPNPSPGNGRIRITSVPVGASIYIMTLSGERVAAKEDTFGGDVHFDLPRQLESGLYLVLVRAPTSSYTLKLLVKR